MPKEQQVGPAESAVNSGFEKTDWQIDESQGREAYTFAERVMNTMDELGISNAERPKVIKDHENIFIGLKAGQHFDGRLPISIRRLTWDQLSELYTLFSNWYKYVMDQLHRIMVERSEAKRQRDLVWSIVRQQYKWDPDNVDNDGRPKKRSPQEMTDMARQDSRFVEVDARYEELNTLYYYLEAMTLVAEQDMKVISREVTIQQVKAEQECMRRGMGNLGSIGSRLSTVSPRSFQDSRIREEAEENAEQEPVEARPTRKPIAVNRAVVKVKVPGKPLSGGPAPLLRK